jgi:hypothetical protein
MQIHTLASAASPSAARLLIHAVSDDGSASLTFESWIRRLREHVRDGPHGAQALRVLEIRDLAGHRVLAIDDAGALVDVTLPPGTYHVSASLGGARRSYTVALEPGACFDLYVHAVRDRH